MNPAIFNPPRTTRPQIGEPPGRGRLGHHVRISHEGRSVLGVFACTIGLGEREQLIAWKTTPAGGGFDPVPMARYAAAIERLVGMMTGRCFPPRAIVMTPPQGASSPGPHAAEAIAREVARRLGLEFIAALARTDVKTAHGPWSSRAQLPYVVRDLAERPGLAVIVDDLITSRTTMRLAIEALRAVGIPCIAVAYSAPPKGSRT